MQLSYNVIKKHQVNSNTVYTIEAPVVKLKSEVIDIPDDNSDDEGDSYSRELISQAEAKARDIVNGASKEAESIKKEAYDTAFKNGYGEGMKKGFEDGLKRGSEKGYKDTQIIRNQAGVVLKEAHRVSREYIDAQRGEIVDLAMAIAEKIIGYQADTNDSVVINIVKDAISSSVCREQLIIRVNPMDYAIIDCRRDEIVKMAGGDKIINIIKDDEIKRGGCRLDTGASSVDAAIDEQLQKIREALLGQ